MFSGRVNGRSYRADLELHQKIEANICHWEMKSNQPVLKLVKQQQGHWERLIRSKVPKLCWLCQDYFNSKVVQSVIHGGNITQLTDNTEKNILLQWQNKQTKWKVVIQTRMNLSSEKLKQTLVLRENGDFKKWFHSTEYFCELRHGPCWWRRRQIIKL